MTACMGPAQIAPLDLLVRHQVLDWRRRSGGAKRRAQLRPAIPRKSEASEADQHHGPGGGFGDNSGARTTEASTAEVAAAGAVVFDAAIVRDCVAIHRNRAGQSDGSAAQDTRGGIQGDARISEDVSGKRRTCTQRSGGTNFPVDASIRIAIQHVDSRSGGGGQRRPYLKYEGLIRIGGKVESE